MKVSLILLAIVFSVESNATVLCNNLLKIGNIVTRASSTPLSDYRAMGSQVYGIKLLLAASDLESQLPTSQLAKIVPVNEEIGKLEREIEVNIQSLIRLCEVNDRDEKRNIYQRVSQERTAHYERIHQLKNKIAELHSAICSKTGQIIDDSNQVRD